MTYRTNVGIYDEQNMEKLSKVCSDIHKKDSTWIYKIKKSMSKKFKYILTVYSKSKEEANKRGGWLIHKMKDAKISDYFWINTQEETT